MNVKDVTNGKNTINTKDAMNGKDTRNAKYTFWLFPRLPYPGFPP